MFLEEKGERSKTQEHQEEATGRHREEDDVKTAGRGWSVQPQARECQLGSLEAGRSMEQIFCQSLSSPPDTLILEPLTSRTVGE